MLTNTPVVSVIIPNWNRYDLTVKAIQSVFNSKPRYQTEVIVVDNGSTDGSSGRISESFPEVRIVQNAINRGFAGGNNDAARVSDGKYLLLLNNDAELLGNCIDEMVAYLDAHDDAGVVGAKVLLLDQPDRLDSALTYLLPFGYCSYRGHGELDSKQFSKREDVFCVKGACMMVRASSVRDVGLFYDDFFMYFEETDFCWRLWTMGLRTVYLPEARAIHAVGKSVHELPSAFVDYHSFKNRLASAVINFETRSLLFALPVQVVIIVIGAIAYVATGRRKNAGALLRALHWNIRNVGQNLTRRKSVQSRRLLRDADILSRVGSKFELGRFARFAMAYIARW